MDFYKYRRFYALSDKLCRFLFLLFLILILYGFDSKFFVHLSLIAAGIHELSHIFASSLTQADVEIPKTAYDGFRLPLKLIKNSRISELFIILAGPSSNLICALFMLSKSAYLYEFGAINLITAIANLLPCHGNDGFRILNILVSLNGESHDIALGYLSLFISVAVLFFSLFMSYRTGSALWLSSLYLVYTLLELEKMRKAAFFRKNEKNRDI